MTRDETTVIMLAMKSTYPSFYRDMSKDEVRAAIDIWTEMFAEDSAAIVTQAVKALMTTLKFPPTIADVKDKIRMLTEKPSMTEHEAWNQVKRAIQGAYYEGQRNFDNLPEDIKAVVGTPKQLAEWGQMDESEVNTVVASNFMRSYKVKQQ